MTAKGSVFGAALSRAEIMELLSASPPLVEGLLSTDEQVQPNGIDLTLREVALFSTAGRIGIKSQDRVIPLLSPLVFDGLGFIDLVPECYLVTYNEVVHLPNDVMALAKPRSSLLRCGVSVETAVWDAGYEGRSQSLMVVHNPLGFRIQKNARVVQLVFLRLTSGSEGYKGAFQRENI